MSCFFLCFCVVCVGFVQDLTNVVTCGQYQNCFDESTLAGLNNCLNGGTHGPVHIKLGGEWNNPEQELAVELGTVYHACMHCIALHGRHACSVRAQLWISSGTRLSVPFIHAYVGCVYVCAAIPTCSGRQPVTVQCRNVGERGIIRGPAQAGGRSTQGLVVLLCFLHSKNKILSVYYTKC